MACTWDVKVSTKELRKKLSFFRVVVTRGETITVTHYGRPWGQLTRYVPPPSGFGTVANRDPITAAGAFLGIRPAGRDRRRPGRSGYRFNRCAAAGSDYLVARSVLESIEAGDQTALGVLAEARSLAVDAYTWLQMVSGTSGIPGFGAFKMFLHKFSFERVILNELMIHRALTFMELFGFPGQRSTELYPEEAILAGVAIETERTVLTTDAERLVQIPRLRLAVTTQSGVVSPSGDPAFGNLLEPHDQRPHFGHLERY